MNSAKNSLKIEFLTRSFFSTFLTVPSYDIVDDAQQIRSFEPETSNTLLDTTSRAPVRPAFRALNDCNSYEEYQPSPVE
jgi:hypothetical protein